MKKCKLILFDLDGTALKNDRKSLSQKLISALEKAHNAGIHIAPITGRAFFCLPPQLKTNLPWKDIAVVNNGSEYRRFSDGQVISSVCIPWHYANEIIRIAEEYCIPIEINAPNKIILTKKDYESLIAFNFAPLQHHIENDLKNYAHFTKDLKEYASQNRGELLKLTMPFVASEKRDEFFQKIKEFPVSCVWGSAVGMEITESAATKGNSLLWLCEYYGITKEECIAFGDSGNDISMLELAGIGVAMGNAPEFVKDSADLVADTNNNDGVAKIIEEIIL